MTVQRETFTDRTKAGRALVFLAAAMKPFTTSKTLGMIGGFPFPLQRLEAKTTLTLHGKHCYDAYVSDNALVTVASIEHALGSIDERLRQREADLTQFSRQREDLTKQVGQPFEHEQKLTGVTKRQGLILAARDITKNQGSAKVDEGSAKVPQVNAESIHEVRATPKLQAAERITVS